MKIAIPVDGLNVNQHFGRSKAFAVIDIQGRELKGSTMVSAENLAHNHEGLAGLLKGENVETVIVGGIGPMAKVALEQAGLQVITGAGGPIKEVAGLFARGQLISKGVSCDHRHDHGCGKS